jgi:hypothetical protein
MTFLKAGLRLGILLAAGMILSSCAERPASPTSSGPKRTKPVQVTSAESSLGSRFVSDHAEAVPVATQQPESDQDATYREKLVGTWKQYETGVRWLTVRPDGTATMVVDPDWVAKAVIGSRLTVEIEWTVEEGRALFRSVSGKPETAFQAVCTLYGRDRNRPIVEMTEEKFVLLDESDGSRSEWTRIKKGETAPAMPEG